MWPIRKLAPDVTVAVNCSKGFKNSKKRIIVIPCANTDVSEKFTLMLIGNAYVCERSIKDDKDCGLDYHAKIKAWYKINFKSFDNQV